MGYDQALLSQYQGLMQGVYVDNVSNVPFEAVNSSQLMVIDIPECSRNISAMRKYEPGFVMNGVSLRWMVVGGFSPPLGLGQPGTT